jgi:hypothetical protein
MALTQYFAGTDWQVDVEVDLSLQQQRPAAHRQRVSAAWAAVGVLEQPLE